MSGNSPEVNPSSSFQLSGFTSSPDIQIDEQLNPRKVLADCGNKSSSCLWHLRIIRLYIIYIQPKMFCLIDGSLVMKLLRDYRKTLQTKHLVGINDRVYRPISLAIQDNSTRWYTTCYQLIPHTFWLIIPSRLSSSPLMRIFSIFPALYNCSAASIR